MSTVVRGWLWRRTGYAIPSILKVTGVVAVAFSVEPEQGKKTHDVSPSHSKRWNLHAVIVSSVLCGLCGRHFQDYRSRTLASIYIVFTPSVKLKISRLFIGFIYVSGGNAARK